MISGPCPLPQLAFSTPEWLASKANQVYIERIDLRGNIKTRDEQIRREMQIYEGELFSGTGERRSRERVTALGRFETVEVQHKPGSDDSKVVVTVEVKEKDAAEP